MQLAKQVVVVLMLVSLVGTTTAQAAGIGVLASAELAQKMEDPGKELREKYTRSQGIIDGEQHAEISGPGKFGTGLVVGALSGLIGTAIGYYMIGPAQTTGEQLATMSGKGGDYRLGFKSGWNQRTKQKKRRSFLIGGLLGTAAFVELFLN